MRKSKSFYYIVAMMLSINTFICCCNTVSAKEMNGYEDEILEIMEEKRAYYSMDSEFYREANSKNMNFEELLRQRAVSTYETRERLSMYSEIRPYDMGNNGQYLSTNVPLIQQTKSYNCGPTSALQVLYGMSCQSLVNGQNDAAKIEQLEADSGTDTTGTMVYRLTNTLNQYATRADYEYILGSSMTKEQFQGKVETSLYYNFAPILHARTQYLSYYGGHSSGHYIAVREVDTVNETIKLQDCNYNNNFFGQHVVSIDEAFDAIHAASSRYLICMEY